jgi:hypothetical protein
VFVLINRVAFSSLHGYHRPYSVCLELHSLGVESGVAKPYRYLPVSSSPPVPVLPNCNFVLYLSLCASPDFDRHVLPLDTRSSNDQVVS